MIRFINYEFRCCLHCLARYIKDCEEKITIDGVESLPERCWRNEKDYCVIKDSPNYKKEDAL
jgi:hypothetical protein